MHNLVSIFRCEFVSVSNIEQNICSDCHEIFKIGQTLHKEQPGALFSEEYVCIVCVCVCVCVCRCVCFMCAAGVGVLIDCFVSGYTNFIHFLFCFCSNQRTCYNHSCSQQYFTCIMQGKVHRILSLCSIFLINWWTQLHNTPWSEYVAMESITFRRSLSIYMNQLF